VANLDPDAPVAEYWPEFAQNGKEKIPVRYLLSHQAGLAFFEETIPVAALYDWDRIINMLEKQKPAWEPGKHSGYHGITFGYLVGEVVRRITKKTLGTFFREEVALPLKADFYIGVPEEYEYRVGEVVTPPAAPPGEPGSLDPNSLAGKMLLNPPMTDCNKGRAWRAAEIPAANGHGNAHSIARVGAALACGGSLDGVRLLSPSTIEKAIEEQCYGADLVLGLPVRYGLGVGLNSKEIPISPNPRAFYWSGFGGSTAVVDLDARLSFSYVPNKGDSPVEMRGPALSQALYAALA
jgi:CubicO group peptidase (beta-lactamase class C family)